MKIMAHVYGSIRLVIDEEEVFDFEEFNAAVASAATHPKAAFVVIPESHFCSTVKQILDLNKFVFHYHQPNAKVFVYKGGGGVKFVPAALNAHIGVAAVVFSQNSQSILLIHEERERVNRDTKQVEKFTIWKPVTGSVDVGELPRAAVLRELREEVGIQLEDPQFRLLEDKSSLSFEGFSDTCLYYALIVPNELAIGQLQVEEGIKLAKWITCEEIATMDVSPMTKHIAALVIKQM